MKPLFILICLLPTIAFSAPKAIQHSYKHPERYSAIFARLTEAGIPSTRIREIFTSPKAQERDPKAVRLLSDVSEIPKHKQAEHQANHRYLQETALLKSHLQQHQSSYARAEARYGVSREIIGAILLKESALGQYDAFTHEAFVVYNSLLDQLEVPATLNDDRARARTSRLLDLAQEQLIALLIYCNKRGIDITDTDIPSSYAGAIGIPQFLPSNLEYAVSADGSPPDLSQIPDAILSTANILRNKFDWPEKMVQFDRMSSLDQIIAKWREFNTGSTATFTYPKEVNHQSPKRFDQAYGKLPQVSYIARYARSLMQYNFSSEYALGVLQIAYKAHIHLTDSSGIKSDPLPNKTKGQIQTK